MSDRLHEATRVPQLLPEMAGAGEASPPEPPEWVGSVLSRMATAGMEPTMPAAEAVGQPQRDRRVAQETQQADGGLASGPMHRTPSVQSPPRDAYTNIYRAMRDAPPVQPRPTGRRVLRRWPHHPLADKYRVLLRDFRASDLGLTVELAAGAIARQPVWHLGLAVTELAIHAVRESAATFVDVGRPIDSTKCEDGHVAPVPMEKTRKAAKAVSAAMHEVWETTAPARDNAVSLIRREVGPRVQWARATGNVLYQRATDTTRPAREYGARTTDHIGILSAARAVSAAAYSFGRGLTTPDLALHPDSPLPTRVGGAMGLLAARLISSVSTALLGPVPDPLPGRPDSWATASPAEAAAAVTAMQRERRIDQVTQGALAVLSRDLRTDSALRLLLADCGIAGEGALRDAVHAVLTGCSLERMSWTFFCAHPEAAYDEAARLVRRILEAQFPAATPSSEDGMCTDNDAVTVPRAEKLAEAALNLPGPGATGDPMRSDAAPVLQLGAAAPLLLAPPATDALQAQGLTSRPLGPTAPEIIYLLGAHPHADLSAEPGPEQEPPRGAVTRPLELERARTTRVSEDADATSGSTGVEQRADGETEDTPPTRHPNAMDYKLGRVLADAIRFAGGPGQQAYVYLGGAAVGTSHDVAAYLADRYHTNTGRRLSDLTIEGFQRVREDLEFWAAGDAKPALETLRPSGLAEAGALQLRTQLAQEAVDAVKGHDHTVYAGWLSQFGGNETALVKAVASLPFIDSSRAGFDPQAVMRAVGDVIGFMKLEMELQEAARRPDHGFEPVAAPASGPYQRNLQRYFLGALDSSHTDASQHIRDETQQSVYKILQRLRDTQGLRYESALATIQRELRVADPERWLAGAVGVVLEHAGAAVGLPPENELHLVVDATWRVVSQVKDRADEHRAQGRAELVLGAASISGEQLTYAAQWTSENLGTAIANSHTDASGASSQPGIATAANGTPPAPVDDAWLNDDGHNPAANIFRRNVGTGSLPPVGRQRTI